MEDVKINVIPEGKELVIRQGEAPEVFVYGGYHYDAYSTPSLIELVKAKGSKENSVIAYSDSGVKVILDCAVIDRDQDRISYEFKKSLQLEEWLPVLKGTSFEQKKLIDFLRRREEGEVDDIEWLVSQIQQFKYVTTISGDFTYDDNNNYTFAIKVGEAEGTVKMPQVIMANIEIFNESGFVQPMEIEVEVIKPRSEDEKPYFKLCCPKYARYYKRALDYEVERLKKDLDGYLIVTGSI